MCLIRGIGFLLAQLYPACACSRFRARPRLGTIPIWIPSIGIVMERELAQNIYDTPEFFEGYSRLNRSVHGLDGAPEWPAIRALLPDLSGRRIVDLGCGFGWFARWARTQGAAHVLGVDLSEKMLSRARAEIADPAVQYVKADLESLELPEGAFDLAYSSL